MDGELPDGFTLDPPAPQPQGGAELPDGFTLDAPAQPEKPMPGPLTALQQGVGASIRDLSQGVEAIQGKKPSEYEESPAAQPFEWSWYPHQSGVSKTLYQLGKSAPSLGGGIAGGVVGGAAGEAFFPAGGGFVGGLAGGSLGAGSVSAAQAVGPYFAKHLKENPENPDAAFDAALKDAEISGAFSSASWAAFPLKAFSGPIKNLLFQAFGVQPGIGVAERYVTNVREGQPVTEGLGQAYGQGAVGTFVPMAGHALAARGVNTLRGRAPAEEGKAPTEPPAEPQPGSADFPPGFTLDNPPTGAYPNAPDSLRALHEKTRNLTPSFFTPKEREQPAPVSPKAQEVVDQLDALQPEKPTEAPGQAETEPAPNVAQNQEAPAAPAPVEAEKAKPAETVKPAGNDDRDIDIERAWDDFVAAGSDNRKKARNGRLGIEEFEKKYGLDSRLLETMDPKDFDDFKQQIEDELANPELPGTRRPEQQAKESPAGDALEPAQIPQEAVAAEKAIDHINSLSPEQQRRQLPEFSEGAVEPHAQGAPEHFMFDPATLNIDANRFQFKSGGDEYGVTGALRSVSKWDPAKAQTIMVWEQKDGKLFVADGHQRAGLARRLTEQGKASGIKLPGILYREADGVTASDMKAIAAATNIANGSGSALDGAKVLRAKPELMDGSLPLSAGKGQQAAALARLDDEAFRMVVNDVVPEHQGAIVGELIPNDPARQIAAMKAIARFEPKNVEETAALVQRVAQAELAKAEEGRQTSMFGDLETPDSTAGEEMRIVGRAIKDLKKDKALFARVVANAEGIEQTGSHIERETAKSVATDSDYFAKKLTSDAYSIGPIRDELIAAARDLKNGTETLPGASARILAAIRRTLEKDVAHRAGDLQGNAAARGETEGGGTSDIFAAAPQREVAPEPQFEPGAEGKPQQLIPGVKPVTDRERLQLQANAPLRGGNRDLQHEGLFGDAQHQQELFGAGTAKHPALHPENAPDHGAGAPQGRSEVQGQEHGGGGKRADEAGERVAPPAETPEERKTRLGNEFANKLKAADAKVKELLKSTAYGEAEMSARQARIDAAKAERAKLNEDLKEVLGIARAEPAAEQAAPQHDIGDRVNFTLPGIVGNGKPIRRKMSGIVEKIDNVGRLYVRAAEGGLHWLAPWEATNAGAVPGAKERIQKIDSMMASNKPAEKQVAAVPDHIKKMQDFLKKAKTARFKTASDERLEKLYQRRLDADPAKFAPGQGVAWKVTDDQTNHGFRIAEVHPEDKMATIRQVADTGITTTGGDHDRIKPQKVYLGELKREKKYDALAPEKPSAPENNPETRGKPAETAPKSAAKGKIAHAVEAGVIPPEANAAPHIEAGIERIAKAADKVETQAPAQAPTLQSVKDIAPSLAAVYKEIDRRFGKDGWGNLTPAEKQQIFDHFSGKAAPKEAPAPKADPISDAVAKSFSKQDPEALAKLNEVQDAYIEGAKKEFPKPAEKVKAAEPAQMEYLGRIDPNITVEGARRILAGEEAGLGKLKPKARKAAEARIAAIKRDIARLEAAGGKPGEQASAPQYALGSSQDQTQTPAFKRWFGKSKVVDENGRPLVVYHGTNKNFEAFSREGNVRRPWGDAVGHYFTKNAEDASSYAQEQWVNGKKDASNANVVPVYLSIKNPLRVPENGYEHTYITPERLKELESLGYDGIIAGDFDEVIAFRPDQIKSAIGNRGTFDPNDPRIQYAVPEREQAHEAGPSSYTPEFQSRAREVAKAIEDQIKGWLPKDAVVRVMDRLTRDLEGGRHQDIEGRTDAARGLIDIAMRGDPERALAIGRHEAVHYLKELGFFSPQEWRLLSERAKKVDALEKRIVTDPESGRQVPALAAYRKLLGEQVKDLRLSPDEARAWIADRLDSERVAHMAEDWTGGKQFGPGIGGLFERAGKFFEAIRNAVRGLGFQTWDDVFARTFSGEQARRNAAPEAKGDAQYAIGATTPAAAGGFNQIPDGPIGRQIHKLIEWMKVGNIVRDLQIMTTPMAVRDTGIQERAAAKDFADYMTWVQLSQNEWLTRVMKKHTPEELKRIWEAGDEENLLRLRGEDTTGRGIDALPPRLRETIDMIHERDVQIWDALKACGRVEDTAEGMPYWMHRRVMLEGASGWEQPTKTKGGRPLDEIGRNLTEYSPALKHRKYETVEETEAAAKGKFGDTAQVVRDIRAHIVAQHENMRVIAGRAFMNRIREQGRQAGVDTVIEGEPPDHQNWFTLPQHSLFWEWKLKLQKGEDGKWHAVLKEDGKPVFEKIPLYVNKSYEGPMRAVLSRDMGELYRALMTVKMNSVGLIMYSPFMHNMVEYSRAFPMMPLRMLIFQPYRIGFKAKNDLDTMREFILEGNGRPIGDWRGHGGDMSELLSGPGRTADKGWLTRGLRKYAGDVPADLTGQALHFWHQRLLWDQIANLQMGLYVLIRDQKIREGMDPYLAKKEAGHIANRYAGAVPAESLSAGARALANCTMFSRSYTLGNIGIAKDIGMGLPSDVQAQIARDRGLEALAHVKSDAQRKAIEGYMLDTAFFYISNSLLQHGMNNLYNNEEADPIVQGYAKRWQEYVNKLSDVREHPLNILLANPFALAEHLSATHNNEPGKENRIWFGKNSEGTNLYWRSPLGKFGEELLGYPTEPLAMIARKESTLFRPLQQVFANDKGFGGHRMPIYNQNARLPEEYAENIGKIVSHFVEAQLPMPTLNAIADVASGAGNRDTQMAALRTVAGGLTGMMPSQGYPGGTAQALLNREKENYEYHLGQHRTELAKLIRGGKDAEAQKLMDQLGMPPKEQKQFRDHILAPGKISKQKAQGFNLRASPEELERFERSLNP